MIRLDEIFGKVIVLNLRRDEKRKEAFQKRAAAAGLDPDGYQFVEAVDGNIFEPPMWWGKGKKSRKGSWGCLQSHIRIATDALHERVKSLLIFEDDCVFCDSFVERLREVLSEVRDDWRMLYLGGQHRLNDGEPWFEMGKSAVIRARSVIRTHAFAVNGDFLARYLRHICEFPRYQDRMVNYHVDHQLSRLHLTSPAKVYCAYPWLCGQAAGYSGIAKLTRQENWWEIPRTKISLSPLDPSMGKVSGPRLGRGIQLHGLNGPMDWR